MMSVTQCDEKKAMEYLKKANWKLDQAIDLYFSNSSSSTSNNNTGNKSSPPPPSTAIKVDTAKLEALYTKYAGGNNAIGQEGIMKFCEDVKIDPSDVSILVLSCRIKATTMGVYKKEEFMRIGEVLKTDSVEAMTAKILALKDDLKENNKFKEVYSFAFDFGREGMQKSLQMPMAMGLWQLLLADRNISCLPLWLEFLESQTSVKVVSKDTWQVFLDFATTIKPDFSNYDEASAWPVLVDNFVSYARQKLSSN